MNSHDMLLKTIMIMTLAVSAIPVLSPVLLSSDIHYVMLCTLPCVLLCGIYSGLLAWVFSKEESSGIRKSIVISGYAIAMISIATHSIGYFSIGSETLTKTEKLIIESLRNYSTLWLLLFLCCRLIDVTWERLSKVKLIANKTFTISLHSVLFFSLHMHILGSQTFFF